MASIPEDFAKASPLIWRARKIALQLFSPKLWRQRLFVWLGALMIGVIAAGFSVVADHAQGIFSSVIRNNKYWPLVVSPLGFALTGWLTQRWFPSISGSGIPQAIAAHQLGNPAARRWLLGPRVIVGKISLTALGLLCGASIGREGPTVQVGASLLRMCSGFQAANRERSLILAGAAAGVAAAFNTPLAGIVFAIEEMARGFERRSTSVILTAIVLAGVSSMSILGNYNYFGQATAEFSLEHDWIPLLIIGVVGGLLGAGFAWLLTRGRKRLHGLGGDLCGRHPVIFAAVCGLVIAGLGLATDGATYGTGYALANDILQCRTAVSWDSAFAKLLATAVSTMAGIPGGIFSPSLSVGAALGSSMMPWFSHTEPQIVVLLTMVAYFSGVTQAPITAAIVVLEVTGKAVMPAPLIAVAAIAAAVARVLCPTSLYHALASEYVEQATRSPKQKQVK